MTNHRDFPWNRRPEYVAIQDRRNGRENVRNSRSVVSVNPPGSRHPTAFVARTAGTASSDHGASRVSHNDRDDDQPTPTKRQMLEKEIEKIREEMRSINQRLDALKDRMLEHRFGAYRREP